MACGHWRLALARSVRRVVPCGSQTLAIAGGDTVGEQVRADMVVATGAFSAWRKERARRLFRAVAIEAVDAAQACAHRVLALWARVVACHWNQLVDGVRHLSGVSAMGIQAPMAWVSLLY